MWLPGEHRTRSPIRVARSMVRLCPSWVSVPTITYDRKQRVVADHGGRADHGPGVHDRAHADDRRRLIPDRCARPHTPARACPRSRALPAARRRRAPTTVNHGERPDRAARPDLDERLPSAARSRPARDSRVTSPVSPGSLLSLLTPSAAPDPTVKPGLYLGKRNMRIRQRVCASGKSPAAARSWHHEPAGTPSRAGTTASYSAGPPCQGPSGSPKDAQELDVLVRVGREAPDEQGLSVCRDLPFPGGKVMSGCAERLPEPGNPTGGVLCSCDRVRCQRTGRKPGKEAR